MEDTNNPTTLETTPAPAPTAPVISARTQAACDIATGRVPADPATMGVSMLGAKKDLNCKGRGPEWHRMVWRGGSWNYVSSERLPSGSFRASERRAEVSGEVYPGEIIAQHDRGGPIDAAYLILEPQDGKFRLDITVAKRRDGQLVFKLPDGSEVLLPNPRSR